VDAPSRMPLRDHRLNGDVDISAPAALIGDDARAAMLLALGGGLALPATALASAARVGRPTASRHLARLVEGGLLSVEPRGRSRYYRLANEQVGLLVETLAGLAPLRPPRTLAENTRMQALRSARTCYDHLAGQLGVAVFEALVARAALVDLEVSNLPGRKVRSGLGSVSLGPSALEVFGELGVDLDGLGQTQRPLATACLDWTENRPHLAGALGAAVCSAFVQAGWVRRRSDSRAVTLTSAGQSALAQLTGTREQA
jgi:DNA-binding transcriptional ArsR family regulator